MRLAFRTDASTEIGTGHVMRCLTLADALREGGAECVFLCRPHEGNLIGLVAVRGHGVAALPVHAAGTVSTPGPAAPTHAHWLGADWANDAEDSRDALAGKSIDWLVVDHYALDRNWEQAMRPACRGLLVIDDLADRPHDCDLLLDQNLGRRAEDYRGLLPPGAQTLIGPRYALLRPEFSALRAASLARREHPRLEHVLVTMGGVDKDNATGAVLDALEGCDLPPDLRITVVLGPHAPWLEAVRARAGTMQPPTRVLAGVNDMARLMSDADLAIGAAGSTSWERCCLGLPTIQLVLAENQRVGAVALHETGAAIAVRSAAEVTDLLQTTLLSGTMSEFLRNLGLAAAEVADGNGVARMLHSTVSRHERKL